MTYIPSPQSATVAKNRKNRKLKKNSLKIIYVK